MEIQELENKRATYHAKFRKALKIATIVACVWSVSIALVSVLGFVNTDAPAFAYFFTVFSALVSALFPFAIIMVIFFFKNHKALNEYRSLYKTVFVEKALREAFPGCIYKSEAGIGRDELGKLGMVYTGDVYRSEDLICGEYNGLKFRQADVLIQEREEDEDGHTHYRTVFMGRWAVFDIKKSFQYRLAVVGKGFGVASLRSRDKIHKFRRITLESDAFHNRFRVYAEDGFEAFYLLDPAFIERVERLGEAHGGRVALFFVQGELHIAVDNQSDAFEVASINKPIDAKAEVAKVRADIKLITDIVDSLKLK